MLFVVELLLLPFLSFVFYDYLTTSSVHQAQEPQYGTVHSADPNRLDLLFDVLMSVDVPFPGIYDIPCYMSQQVATEEDLDQDQHKWESVSIDTGVRIVTNREGRSRHLSVLLILSCCALKYAKNSSFSWSVPLSESEKGGEESEKGRRSR